MSLKSADNSTSPPPKSTVAIIGAGSIGTAFSVVFATAGHKVRICDPSETQRRSIRQRVTNIVHDLDAYGLVDQSTEQVLSRVHVCSDVGDAVIGVDHVQECAPEDIPLKRRLFAELDLLTPKDAVLASSSSAITISEIAIDLNGAHRCLVAHPGNPPFLIRVIEIVPAPFTSPDVVERTGSFMRSVALSPVTVRKEIRGFVFNRLQGALLREAYCLVRDGVAGVEEIDSLVRDGLGLRWSVVGPFETADLNRRGGIGAHAEIMGDAYAAMGAERGQHDSWTPDLIRKVEAERRALLALGRWEERVRWRDQQLMLILAARSQSRRR